MINVDFYGKLPRLTDKIVDTAEENESDWSRHPELASCELMMWEHGSRNA